MGGTVCGIRTEDPALEAGQVQQRGVHLSCLTRSGKVHSRCTAGLGHHPRQALLSPSLRIIFSRAKTLDQSLQMPKATTLTARVSPPSESGVSSFLS